MDTEGARALAARIAAGPPDEDGNPKPETPGEPAAAPESAVEIVYLKPEQAPRREVRTYVRGRDGSLERQP
jgi:hypothetical protein